ncbi:Tetrapyrrole (Corrin/Porphyrin) Methylases [Candidatus Methanoperedenaceae archaeon GB37]|nr:Tetrapyrrole (Corrin/Porphyrin) Methylases [Candidatus Methanoperedenaceae archaeon GB37]
MLVGVGLGPGSPDLLTLRAVEVLKESKRVYVPGKLAYELVKPYRDAIILDFPMIHNKCELERIWEKNARIIGEDARDGIVSFALIGDPNFFSTFTHLKRKIVELYPGIVIDTVPGVSSITAFASRAGVEVDSSFEVSDGSDARSKIVMKVRKPREVVESLKKDGYTEFVLFKNLFMRDEAIYRSDLPDRVGYLSILYAKKGDKP